jgi:plastocyanin
MTKRGLITTLIVGTAAALTMGCGSSSKPSSANAKTSAPPASAPVQGGIIQIAYHNVAITPEKLKVKIGSTIKWTNHDSIEHNVTSQSGPEQFASTNLHEGGSFQIKANKPGVIHYECSLHPASMTGVIEVLR